MLKDAAFLLRLRPPKSPGLGIIPALDRRADLRTRPAVHIIELFQNRVFRGLQQINILRLGRQLRIRARSDHVAMAEECKDSIVFRRAQHPSVFIQMRVQEFGNAVG